MIKIKQLKTGLNEQKQILPILLLTAYCVDALIAASSGTIVMADRTYNYDLTPQHYIALIAVTVNWLSYFFTRKFYKYFLGITIVSGLFNLMVFPAIQTTQSFSISILKVSFQPSAFLAGLLTYILNFKRVNKFIISQLAPHLTPKEIEQLRRVNSDEEIRKFRNKYKNYSIGDLNQIVSENKFVSGALQAARQLLKEKQASNTES